MTADTRHPKGPWLVADIGGTNARFALYEASVDPADKPLAWARLKTADHPGPAACTRTFLERHWKGPIARAALAIAAPIAGDEVALTNANWRFSIAKLREELAIASLEVINDFAALAHALPLLGEDDRIPLGPDRPGAPGSAMLVIGPGTGLGAAAVIPHEQRGWAVAAGEGGHTTAAARNDREAAVLRAMRGSGRHVSYERVASGPGLVELAQTLAELEGAAPPPDSPAGVVAAARKGDAICREAVALFQDVLATFTGDMALAVGARGGIYLGGGVLTHLDGLFDAEAFRNRLEDKGRFRDYLKEIPLWRLRRADAAFLGLRRLLQERDEDASSS